MSIDNILKFKEWKSSFEESKGNYDVNALINESIQRKETFILEQKSKDTKSSIQELVVKAKETDSKKVKAQSSYEAVMNWFAVPGPSGKVTYGKKGNKRFKPELKTTLDRMKKSMTYWNGDLSSKVTNGNDTKPSKLIDKWLEEDIIKFLHKDNNNRVKKTGRPMYLDKDKTIKIDYTDYLKDDKTNDRIAKVLKKIQNAIDSNIKSGKQVRTMSQYGDNKTGGSNGVVYYSRRKKNGEWWDDETGKETKVYLNAVPFSKSPDDFYKQGSYNFKAGNLYKWLIDMVGTYEGGKFIPADGTKLAEVLNKMSDNKYLFQKAVGINEFDKIKMLDKIWKKAISVQTKYPDGKYDAAKANERIQTASKIEFTPKNAVETKTKEKIKGDPIIDKRTEDFTWPDIEDPVKLQQAGAILYKPDSITEATNIQGSMTSVLKNKIAQIEADGGKITGVEAGVFSSTSVVPSFYNGIKGQRATYENNIPLAKARANDMLTKLKGALGATGLLKTAKIEVKEMPNNPGEHFKTFEEAKTKYEELTNGRTKALPHDDPNRLKYFAPQRFSLVQFTLFVTYTTEEPTEKEITTVDVVGDWASSISFSYKPSGGSSTRRRRNKRKWRINLFPKGGGSPDWSHCSVKDLCAAYGN
jgi:hypothetical protein